jgi:outer membrane protein insertion porin family
MLEDRAQRSQKRLENLDYFSRVRYYLEPSDKGISSTDHEYRNLVYEVEEKNTGSFMVGVGASSVDSVYLSAEVNQNNFDLFAPSKMFRGGGQKGRAYVAWGPRYQCAEVGVVEPYLFNRMLELSVDGYRRMRWYDQYDLIRSGGEASISYPVKFWPTWGPFGRFGVGLSGEFIEFDDVEDGLYEFEGKEVSFRQQEREYGDAFEPVVKLFWAKDSRDNFRIPTKGHRTRLYLDLAPAGDNEYWRLGFNHRSYFNVWQRYNHVLMAGIRAETIDGISDEVPIYNKMFLGGPKSIRGIEYRHVSPMAKTKKGDNWEPWGGQTLLCMNFEYTVPIVKMFRVAVFSDVGSVGVDEFDFDFSDNFAWTVGVGFRLDIPMFPIRLDFATPIEEPDHAEKEVFSFTIGYDF